VEAEKTVQHLFEQACGEVKALAQGWDRDRLTERIREIYWSGLANQKSEEMVPLDRRRRIAYHARALYEEIALAGIGFATVEAGAVFLGHLDMFRTFDGIVRHLPLRGEARQSRSKRGGARRSGLRSFKGWLLGKIVRLYEAHADPRFSSNGPLVRFANTVGELALGEAEPFKPDAVKAEFWRVKHNARRANL
jgi:hypothetical protein